MVQSIKFRLLIVALISGAWMSAAAQSTPDQSPPQNQQSEQPRTPQTVTPESGRENQAPEAEPHSQAPENQSAGPQASHPDANIPVLKRRPKKSTHQKTTSKSQSGKVVVRNGGAKEGSPQLAPGMSEEQTQHNRENTNQLLATTDANLKRVAGRQLSPAQQSMLEEIRTYMTQSKAAASAGDLNRAHTLAYKAHLLSDELAKK
jgi:hypothetical protein